MSLVNLYAAQKAVSAAPAAGVTPVATQPVPGAGDPMAMIGSFLPLIIIFVLFYFMFILPNKKEQKKHAEMINALKEGDKVVTTGGIVGIITGFDEKSGTIKVKSGENTTLNILREYVTKKIEKPL